MRGEEESGILILFEGKGEWIFPTLTPLNPFGPQFLLSFGAASSAVVLAMVFGVYR